MVNIYKINQHKISNKVKQARGTFLEKFETVLLQYNEDTRNTRHIRTTNQKYLVNQLFNIKKLYNDTK